MQHEIVAGIPLLETKLYIPRRRSGLVSRPRLIERLDAGTGVKLVLVCAPAGFGKTTVLTEWLASSAAGTRAAGWVSLDEADNDPALFWTYAVTALRNLAPEVGGDALALLQSPQPPPLEAVLTTLINDVAAIERDLTLIFDDYHVIAAQSIHAAIAFLLDHLPPQLQLVIASRSDPPLPLSRLRGRGQSTELRSADLRFTADEAAAFLHGVMGLDLPAGDVAALERRTEGWITGLQLAALSMQRRKDPSEFVRAFAGDDRYIVDYLVDEVLGRQLEGIRGFLLQTAILDRLSGPLCDAVTGRDDSAAILATLERDNLFVVPLDDRRQWYRYHHLFADVLRAHAAAEEPDQQAVRHRLASAWYERNGFRPDAIRHAFAAGDIERAADLIEQIAISMLGSSQEETLRGWIRAIPHEVLRARPRLSVFAAFSAFGLGDFETADARLQDAERRLEETGGGDDAGTRSLRGMIAIARAYLLGSRGDADGVATYARQAVDLLPEGEHMWRGAAASLLGILHWGKGDLEVAYGYIVEGGANLRRAGHARFQISHIYILADIRIAQGRLREATSLYERGLRSAAEPGELLWGTSDLHVGLSDLHRERNELDAATEQLLRSLALGEHAGLPETRHRWHVAMARIKEAQGDLEGALALFDEATRQRIWGPDPDLRPIAALKARLWSRKGDLANAFDWAAGSGLSVDDDLSFLHEFDHITLAKLLVARYRSERDQRALEDAERLLARLLIVAEAGGRLGSVLEILLSQALAREAGGDVSGALAPLERALTLAEPEGYLRTFVDEGEPMRTLLRHAAAAGFAGPYTQRLLAAFETPAPPASAPAVPGPAVPLTAREIEILRLIAAGMRNQEIADQLYIGLPTVKRHIANAYGKLGVAHRTEAVARASALKLL